jgi:hypothetical protein
MSTYPHGETHAEREQRLREIRHPGCDEFASPDVEPLASRLERAQRVETCRGMTASMMDELQQSGGTFAIAENVWVKGICVPFFVVGWKGLFLVWPIDERWTARQAVMVMPARERIQRELGDAFPSDVEAVFHSPREGTGWHRWVMVDEESGQPFDVVTMGGRIDQLLADWQPVGGVGVDPEWVRGLCQASRPRWWRSGEGRRKAPEPPPHDQLRQLDT